MSSSMVAMAGIHLGADNESCVKMDLMVLHTHSGNEEKNIYCAK